MKLARPQYRTAKRHRNADRFSAHAGLGKLPLLVRLLLGGAIALLAALPTRADEPTAIRAQLIEAYEKSSSVKTAADVEPLVSVCETALAGELSSSDRDYASRLLSWSLTKRADLSQSGSNYDAGQAESDLTRAIELDATNWRALLIRGVVRGEAQRYPEAIADFDAALTLNPKARHAWFNRAEIRAAMGEYVWAADDYNKAIQLSPRDAQAYTGRGHAFFQLERYQQAMADYQKAVLLTEGSPLSLVHRGDLCVRVRLWEKARDDYQLAVARESQSGIPLRRLATLLASCPDQAIQDRQKAVEMAEMALQREPDAPESIATLVLALEAANRSDEGAQRLANWKTEHPEIPAEQVQSIQERLASETDKAVRR